jgi:hypothetical protein
LPGGTEQFRDISQSGYLLSESDFETEACQIRGSSVTQREVCECCRKPAAARLSLNRMLVVMVGTKETYAPFDFTANTVFCLDFFMILTKGVGRRVVYSPMDGNFSGKMNTVGEKM